MNPLIPSLARSVPALAVLLVLVSTLGARPLVIAHRGASGYLPEHTLESASYAYALGADYIEQDVVCSRDDVLVINHDIHIDTTTDVATRFPERKRSDGRYYAIDFDWAELKTLRVHERIDHASGKQVYPSRFPSQELQSTAFRLCRMEEQLDLIRGLNRSTGRKVGVCPEIKDPVWHRTQGKDPGKLLVELLARSGYVDEKAPVLIQCFDPRELQRLRRDFGCKLRLLQLVGPRSEDPAIDFAAMLTPEGLRQVASYAQVISPGFNVLAKALATKDRAKFKTFLADARAAGLLVCPYSLRADELPKGFASEEILLEAIAVTAPVDAVFSDQPDHILRFVEKSEKSRRGE